MMVRLPWIGQGASPGDSAAGEASQQARRMSVIFIALSSIIALAPLPLGAARPIIWDVMALAVAILLLASLRVAAVEMRPLAAALAVPILLFFLVIGFVVVQIVTIVPPDWQNPVWQMAGEVLAGNVRGSIAVDHAAALVGILRLLCYGGIFLLSVLLCRSRERALAAVRLVAFSGGCYAAYGLVVYGFGNGTILWLPKWAYLGNLTGTFVNHNSFATYLGLCFLASLAYLVILLERVRFVGTWRDRLATAIELLGRHPAIVVCIFFLPTALFLTHSRGGFIATLAGSLVFALATSQAPSLRRLRRLRVVALPLVLVVVAFLLSADRLVERMVGIGEDAQARLAIYGSTWRAIADYPIFGTGLGSFASVYPIYRTPEIWGFVDRGHNDYLQNSAGARLSRGELSLPRARLAHRPLRARRSRPSARRGIPLCRCRRVGARGGALDRRFQPADPGRDRDLSLSSRRGRCAVVLDAAESAFREWSCVSGAPRAPS